MGHLPAHDRRHWMPGIDAEVGIGLQVINGCGALAPDPDHRSVSVDGQLVPRLVDLGLTDFFTVPGDCNFVLLDEMMRNDQLTMIGCCSEFHAGYAADGYVRSRGIGAPSIEMIIQADRCGCELVPCC